MITEIKNALDSIKCGKGKPWFASSEFARLAVNGGFELTIRDRLLEPLHQEFQKQSNSISVISEYSQHGFKGKPTKKGTFQSLRADIGIVDGPLCPPYKGKTKAIIELKTNFSSQFGDIKSRAMADWDKWDKARKARSDGICWGLIYNITDITSPNMHGAYFPKYTTKHPVAIKDIESFFSAFAKKENLAFQWMGPQKSSCKYSGCSSLYLDTYFAICVFCRGPRQSHTQMSWE